MFAALVAVIVTGCQDPIFVDTAHVVVRGSVVWAGDPVPNVTVVLELHRASDAVRIGQEPTTTSSTGRFAIELAVVATPPLVALLSATVPATVVGSDSVDGRVEDIPVRLKDRSGSIDTATVSIVLDTLPT